MSGATDHPDERYDGTAVLRLDGNDIETHIVLSGRFEPIDGRFHWSGRVTADDRLTEQP
jgi:hypothetical protein